jgi:hypothetical protein
MSLINDALKKAQKRQAKGEGSLPPPMPGGAPGNIAGRGQPLPAQLFVLFALGATVLIALSVFATVYLLRRPAAPVVAQAPAPAVKAAPITPASPPIVPVSVPPTPHVAPMAAATPEKAAPPATVSAAPAITPATPAVIPPPPAIVVTAPPLDPTKPDPKILAYIDALQVSGVRITATSRKVLTNDHVYRENDLIDRLLGLRLKKIDDDLLTFIDERGVIYTKNF